MNTEAAERAKGFLIGRILTEAKREGIVLSDTEIEVLGFSEAAATPQQLEAMKSFEDGYDDEEYESRIANLIRGAYKHDVRSGDKPRWDQALDDIAEEDMYLAVMLEKAGLLKTTSSLVLPDRNLFLALAPSVLALILAALIAFAPITARLIPNPATRFAIALLVMLAPLLWRKSQTGPRN